MQLVVVSNVLFPSSSHCPTSLYIIAFLVVIFIFFGQAMFVNMSLSLALCSLLSMALLRLSQPGIHLISHQKIASFETFFMLLSIAREKSDVDNGSSSVYKHFVDSSDKHTVIVLRVYKHLNMREITTCMDNSFMIYSSLLCP